VNERVVTLDWTTGVAQMAQAGPRSAPEDTTLKQEKKR
jgi:hypothetical protein